MCQPQYCEPLDLEQSSVLPALGGHDYDGQLGGQGSSNSTPSAHCPTGTVCHGITFLGCKMEHFQTSRLKVHG